MNETIEFLVRHGTTVLFAAVFIEQLGLPLPATPWLLAAGALAGAGKMNWVGALGAAAVGSLLADLIWFYLGRHYGNRVLNLLCRISLEPDSCVRRTQDVFTKYGMKGVVAAKFIPGLSTLAPPLIGFKYLQRHRLLRELRMARITADELHQKQESGENLVVLDLRPHAELKQNPSLIRGALHMTMDEVERRQQELPRDRDIILYCSCPNEVSSARVALLLRQKGIQRVRPLLGGIDAWREQNYPMELSTINMATALDSGAKSREVTLIQETLGQVSAAAEPQPSLKPNETARQD